MSGDSSECSYLQSLTYLRKANRRLSPLQLIMRLAPKVTEKFQEREEFSNKIAIMELNLLNSRFHFYNDPRQVALYLLKDLVGITLFCLIFELESMTE